MDRKTLVFTIDENNIDMDDISKAAEIIKTGGTVVFPTETVYGLGADTFNPDAVRKIFEAKGRPADNPLIVHISDIDMAELVVREIPGSFYKLSEKFWPGPLTMIMYKKPSVPDIVTSGLDTVAVRLPSNLTARTLIKLAGTPLCAPSANISGKPSPTASEHVIDDLFGKADVIIRSIDAMIGLESTVIDLTPLKPVILRPGKITAEEISEVLHTDVEQSSDSIGERRPRSPGMKYRHYAPAADMTLFIGNEDDVAGNILKEARRLSGRYKVGIMSYKPRREYEGFYCRSLTKDGSLDEASRNMYGLLRDFDKAGIEYLLVEPVPEEGIGRAIMNRLSKACGYKIKYL